MGSLLVAIIGIYFFVAIGSAAKLIFRDQLQERTLIIVSIYFLQPFLTFWGLTKQPLDFSLFAAPFWYLVIVCSLLVVMFPLGRLFFADKKRRALFTIASLVGNTANLGIPLGIAIFGEMSVPYTTMINLANVLVVYTLGVYMYSSGSHSSRDSLLNIVKLPILWSAAAALLVNASGVVIPSYIEQNLKLGAYASITIQLLLFGIYLTTVKLRQIDWRLTFGVTSVKFIVLPAITFAALLFIPLGTTVKAILFMELIMPLAVANVNFAALYDCRPGDAAALVFWTSLLFLGYFALILPLIRYWL